MTLTDSAVGVMRLPARKSHGLGQITALIVALAVIGAVVAVWISPLLGAKHIAVHGQNDVPVPSDIVSAVTDAAQITTGTPLARINVAAVAADVMTVPYIAAAVVERHWPDTVIITVDLREAVAVTFANDQWWLLDATGTPFATVDDQPQDLVTLALATPGPDDRATLAALQVAGQLSPEIRQKVKLVSAHTEYDVTLTFAKKRTVMWGTPENSEAKNALIPLLLQQPGRIFDVTDPRLVTVAAGDS